MKKVKFYVSQDESDAICIGASVVSDRKVVHSW